MPKSRNDAAPKHKSPYFWHMKFWKYQGAGNDFVMVDQRSHQWLQRGDTQRIAFLCDRRFGIGGDGLILLQNHAEYDFEMVYFNSDGRESTMCGNGGRCIAAFARHLGIVQDRCRFWAIDGLHEALIEESGPNECRVELKMTEVREVRQHGDAFVLNTGSPHYVRFVKDLAGLDIVSEGRRVRYGEPWKQDGINVNFVEETPAGLQIRTYERGVEDETLACGTGVTAAAIAAWLHQNQQEKHMDLPVKALGGELSVRYNADGLGAFSDIWLCGPAARVFEGEIP